MSGSYFVVSHVSDESKNDGLVESYQMVPVQYQNEDGTLTTVMKRLNFVHWPEHPTPFVHEEWSEDLVFSNIYTPEYDAAGDDEDYEEDGEYEEYEDDEEYELDGDEQPAIE